MSKNSSKSAIIPNRKRKIEKEMEKGCHERIDRERDSQWDESRFRLQCVEEIH